MPCFINFFSVCDAGLVQYRERLPVAVIVGACVGGGLFLIILLCVSVVVLYKKKTSNQSRQQQARPELPQPQPHQQQGTHKDATEQGYITDHTATKLWNSTWPFG